MGKPNHGRLALGLEYGTSLASGAESTLILEGQTILGTTRAEALELDLFQGDILLGYRYAFNDVDSKALLVSVILDVEDPGGDHRQCTIQPEAWRYVDVQCQLETG